MILASAPAGNPGPDFDTELRTGKGLYADSVIAIDAKTGRMLGYDRLVKRSGGAAQCRILVYGLR